MKKLILVLSFCITSLAWANESEGLSAAERWLKFIDVGQYAESWQKSHSVFKSKLTASKWKEALKVTRAPLGEVISRSKLHQKTYSSLPGVPYGEYLVIEFQTEFQHKKSAMEVLTLGKANDKWLPVGYFIK